MDGQIYIGNQGILCLGERKNSWFLQRMCSCLCLSVCDSVPVLDLITGGLPNEGYLFGVGHNKDYFIQRSILSSSYSGKLPSRLANMFVNRLYLV